MKKKVEVFVQLVEQYVERRVQEDRHEREQPLAAQLQGMHDQAKFRMRLEALFYAAWMEGERAGRDALLEEQSEKKKRTTKRKPAPKKKRKAS